MVPRVHYIDYNQFIHRIFLGMIPAGYLLEKILFLINLIPDGTYILLSSMMFQYYDLLGLKFVHQQCPPFVSISDGGHLDNLGLIELLNR
jgi:hypothetical protein